MFPFARRVLSADRIGYAAMQSVLLQVLLVFLNLATGVITARALGADGRGVYAAVSLWPTVVGTAAVAGVADGVLIQLRRTPQAASICAAASFAATASVATLLLAMAWVAMPHLVGQAYQDHLQLARYALVFGYVTALGSLTRHMMTGLGLFALSNLAALLPSVAHLALLAVLLGLGRLTVETALVSVILSGALAVAATFPPLYAQLRAGAARLHSAWREVFSYSKRAAWADWLTLAVNWSDRIVLVPLLSPRELGHYVVAYSVSRGLAVAAPPSRLLLSALSTGDLDAARRIHDLSLRISIAALAIMVGLVVWLSTFAVKLVYGAEFLPAVATLNILAVQFALNRLAQTSAQLFAVANRPGFNSVARAMDVVLSVVLMLALAPTYGATGGAGALLAGTALRLTVSWAGIVGLLRLPFPRLWLQPVDLREARQLLL